MIYDRLKTLGKPGEGRLTYSRECNTGIDIDTDLWYNGGTFSDDDRITNMVREIEREVEEDRRAGKLRPFVEGEPIGALPRRIRTKPLTEKQQRKLHNERMERKRDEMLAMRKRNDAAIVEALE